MLQNLRNILPERDPRPWRLIGFDVHTRLCWRWPFVRVRFGRVWCFRDYVKHELPPA